MITERNLEAQANNVLNAAATGMTLFNYEFTKYLAMLAGMKRIQFKDMSKERLIGMKAIYEDMHSSRSVNVVVKECFSTLRLVIDTELEKRNLAKL